MTDKTDRESKPALSSQDIMFRVGGSTIGGIVVGGALGSAAGPVGSGVGAVVGGVVGLAVSVSDAKKSEGQASQKIAND
jgi:hypothetical protein